MDLQTIIGRLDAGTARAFVSAARHVIDAMLIEAEQIKQTQTPGAMNYESATLSREAPAGGWISDAELRRTTQQLSEAIAAEKWTDGAVFAIKALSALGGL